MILGAAYDETLTIRVTRHRWATGLNAPNARRQLHWW